MLYSMIGCLHDPMQRSGDSVIVSHMIGLHYEFLIIHTVWEFPSLISLNWENMLHKDSHLQHLNDLILFRAWAIFSC